MTDYQELLRFWDGGIDEEFGESVRERTNCRASWDTACLEAQKSREMPLLQDENSGIAAGHAIPGAIWEARCPMAGSSYSDEVIPEVIPAVVTLPLHWDKQGKRTTVGSSVGILPPTTIQTPSLPDRRTASLKTMGIRRVAEALGTVTVRLAASFGGQPLLGRHRPCQIHRRPAEIPNIGRVKWRLA
jgi:hypothetical protein